MKKLLVLCSLIFAASNLSAQFYEGPIHLSRFMGENVFITEYGRRMPVGEVKEIMRGNIPAFEEIRAAQTNYAFSLVFACVGGGMIGWSVVDLMMGENTSAAAAILAGGCASVGIGIVFLSSYNKRSRRAVEIYNQGLPAPQPVDWIELSLVPVPGGAGLVLRF